MKFMMLIVCAVTSLSMVGNAAFAAKKKEAKATKSPKIFLSENDLAFLNIEERVDYLIKLAEYMATYERIQDKVLKLEGKQKPKSAYLEQMKMLFDLLPSANAQGNRSCICGTYIGALGNGKCTTVSPSASCGAGKFTCNEGIFSIPKADGSLEPTCVSTSGSCGDKSTACATELKSKLNAMTDGARVTSWSKRASRGITSTRLANPSSTNISIGDYCSSSPNDKDCKALNDIEKELSARGTQVQSAQARLDQAAADYQKTHNQDPLKSKGIGPDMGAPLIPENGAFPPPPGDDCVSRNQSQLGALACVACGLESADPAVAQGGGAKEFIALMGVVSQTYKGPHATNNPAGRQRLQEDVINRLTTYGYCSDAEYTSGPNGGALSSGSASQIRSIIDGQQSMKRGWFVFKRADNRALAPVMAAFGIEAQTRWGASAYSDDMFGERSGHSSYAQNQQTNFQAISRGYYKGYPHSRFSNCAKAIDSRRHLRPESNVCEPYYRSNRSNWQFNQANMNANDRLASSIRSACGLPEKQLSRWGNRSCRPDCHNTARFHQSFNQGCREGSEGRDPGPGSKGPEEESDRDPGKPGEGGNSDRGSGKDGESGATR